MSMKRTIPGIEKAMFCLYGTLRNNVPTSPVSIGLRKPAAINFEDTEAVKDYKERDLRNKIKASFKAETFESAISVLKDVFGVHALQPGVDLEVVLPEQVGGINRTIKFFATPGTDYDLSLGLLPEFNLTDKERSLKLDFSGTMGYFPYMALISAAQLDNQPHDYWGTLPDENLALRRTPDLKRIELISPGNIYSTLFDLAVISGIKFNIKGVGENNGRGCMQIDYVDITAEVTAKHAELDKWGYLANSQMNCGVEITQYAPAGTETFSVKQGVSTFTVKLGREDGAGKATSVITWKVRRPVSKLGFILGNNARLEVS